MGTKGGIKREYYHFRNRETILNNVLNFCPPKTTEFLWFSGDFRRYEIGILAKKLVNWKNRAIF